MYMCGGEDCVEQGETHHGPHFTLHQWRATQKLNTKDLKHLTIAGLLKHKVHGSLQL